MKTQEFLDFFNLDAEPDEKKHLEELTEAYRTLMKKVAKFDENTGKLLNERELDEHEATVAMHKYLTQRGYDANRLELIGFPALGFVLRRLDYKSV